MNNQSLLGATIAVTSSLLLIIYAGHASEKSLDQGAFFASGKAMVVGYVGAAITIGLTLHLGSIWDLLIICALSFVLGAPTLLRWLGQKTQVVALIGLPAGFIVLLAAMKNWQ